MRKTKRGIIRKGEKIDNQKSHSGRGEIHQKVIHKFFNKLMIQSKIIIVREKKSLRKIRLVLDVSTRLSEL